MADTTLWDDIFTTDLDDYTYDADDYSLESYLNNDATNYYGADDYSWMDDEDFSDPNWLDNFLDPNATNYYGADDYSWIDDYEYGDDYDVGSMDFTPEGQISSWMDNYFEEQGYDSNDLYDFGEETGPFGGTFGPKVRDFFAEFLGLSGGSNNKENDGGGIMDLLSSLAGGTKNMLDNDLIKILLGKKLLDDDRDGGSAGYVPIGQEAYGGGSPLPDYRISNIQPALLPGMAYANQPTTFNNMPPTTAPPPGMQAGGLAHHHPQLHSHAHGSRPNDIPGMPGMQDHLLRPGQPGSRALPMPYKPDGMQAGGIASLENRMDGPGDITQAMLEPGEFVMTRKATQNLTPEYLYSLMHQAENAGRMR